jgi:hypothetical protein
VLASGFLCGVLALVVLFTGPRAFHSPIAILVVASIGFAALLLQFRLSYPGDAKAQPHAWLNIVASLLAIAAVILDFLRIGNQWVQAMALGAIGVFGLSGVFIFHALRRQRLQNRMVPKSDIS